MTRAATILAVMLSCLAWDAAAQRHTIHPKGRTVYLDDVIEIEFPARLTYRGEGMVRQAPVSNLKLEFDYFEQGGTTFARFRLEPALVGPAFFGPIEIFDDAGGKRIMSLPRMEFDVLPPLDDGEAPVEEVFARQKAAKRFPAVARTEIEGELSAGRLVVVRRVLYTETKVPPVRSASIVLKGAKEYRVEFSGDSPSWTSVGDAIAWKQIVSRVAVVPEAAGTIEVEPQWVRLNFDEHMRSSLGHSSLRRHAASPPIRVEAKPTSDAIPVGSFEIDCPAEARRTGAFRVTARVRIRGDADISTSTVTLGRTISVPVLLSPPGLEIPRYSGGSLSTAASFNLVAKPVARDRSEISLPSVTFDYFDPVRNRKASRSCSATVLRILDNSYNDQWTRPEQKEKKEKAGELPFEAMAIFYLVELLGVVFVLLAAGGLSRAIQRP